jgi:magnesium chelatase subunit D
VIGYPFSALVGQDDLRLALLLGAVSPAIGGVLVRGEKGTGKSTAVRALARLLPPIDVVEGCPFNCDPDASAAGCPAGPHDSTARARRPAPLVELPVGASTDRVTGSLDIERALTEGARAFQPGLLASAHRGVLYVDEVNLLGDHLVDLLLDAAAMGVNHVERDGVSVRHPSRFLLVGTMNPEEGELRPQLLDRFGLAVEVAASVDPSERAEIVRRRLAFERDPEGFAASWRSADASLADRIARARARVPSVRLPGELLARISRACAALGVDGVRADIVTAKAAVALAAWEGRREVGLEDVRRAALLALPHRRRRGPLERPSLDPAELERALGSDDPEPGPPRGGPGPAREPAPSPEPEREPGPAPERGVGRDPAEEGRPVPSRGLGPGRPSPREQVLAPEPTFSPVLLEAPGAGRGAPGRRSRAASPAGHPVSDRAGTGSTADLSLPGILRAAAPHQRARGRSGPGLVLRPADLRWHVREGREGNLVLFVVDASGSMAARRRMAAAKGALLSLVLDAYRRRDRVGLVAFRGAGAETVLPPTSSVEVAAARLAALPCGGRTPLAAGLRRAREVLAVEAVRDPRRRPLVVILTDGRATVGEPNPASAALREATELGRLAPAVVVDAEPPVASIGMTRELARALGAPRLRLEQLAAAPLARAVREVLGRGVT